MLLIPGTIWHHPTNDAVYEGFDSNLIYISCKGDGYADGIVKLSAASLELTAPRLSIPTVNLLTTPLHRVHVSLDVVVLNNPPGSTPLRLGVWSPIAGSGYFINFGAGPGRQITAETVQKGLPGHTLLFPERVRLESLGTYELGLPSRVDISVEKDNRIAVTTVSSAGAVGRSLASAADLPTLFNSVRFSLTASATSSTAASRVRLQNYRLSLPHETFWVDKSDDPRVGWALLGLGGLGSLLILAALLNWMRESRAIDAWRSWVSDRRQRLLSYVMQPPPVFILGVGAIVVYLISNILLFTLGGHPFDIASEKLYAYVASRYGPSQLYYLPNLVSFPAIWHGVPYNEAAFPYEPILAYVFLGVGWIGGLVLPSATFTPTGVSLEYIMKGVNVLFGLADGALIYLTLRSFRVGLRWSLIGAFLFLLNPAAWFSMSVWGQTHVISIFFALAAILLAQRGHPVGSWIFLAGAALTRPQMLAFLFVVGLVLLRRFRLTENLRAISWAVITVFILLLPFTVPTTAPSLPVDVMVNTFHIQEGGGNGPQLTTVSQDAYSIWPLVTYLLHGTSGLYRSFTPSAETLWGPLSYQRAGLMITAISLIAVAVLLLRRRRPEIDAGAYLPLVAVGITAFLMFMTGLVSTHFLLALPFLILCRRWLSSGWYLFVISVWTITTLVPMYGDMGNVIRGLNYPLLAPEHNAATRFVFTLYSWDRFITVATVANLCVLAVIAVAAVRSKPEAHQLQPAT